MNFKNMLVNKTCLLSYMQIKKYKKGLHLQQAA